MKHCVFFKNCDNKWDNALPLGNGNFGAMLYYEKQTLNMVLNHYEIYYNKDENVLPRDILANTPPSATPAQRKERFFRQAIENIPPEGEPFCIYNFKRQKSFDPNTTDISRFTSSYPQTGEISIEFDTSSPESLLTLCPEEGKVSLELNEDNRSLIMDSVVLRKDCMVNHINQSDSRLTKSLKIFFPPTREREYPDITYKEIDSKTFAYTVRRRLGGKKEFTFSVIMRLSGAEGKLTHIKHGAEITLTNCKNEIDILTAVFTDWKYSSPMKEGTDIINTYLNCLDKLKNEHSDYWRSFFMRSQICLPDKFLEKVYYINLYALDSSSGKDGIMKHHACGLNGLWDTKHTNLWGSMWYWDVNIQAAFAGAFSGNRPELAKVFSDGLLSYTALAERFARDVHNMEALAGDYPHHTYYCIWPWCAQYLWFLYQYTLDEEYLRYEAYPLFIKLCSFYTEVFKYNEETDCYSIYPDVSPEQGPFAHDTVITVASVKYLFRFTLEAARILNDDNEILSTCRNMLQKMPSYPTCTDSVWGNRLKDSPDAPDNLWIRHPSMLMPLFPAGEFGLSSSPEEINMLSNTVDYLEERMEIGIFGGSWLATAAARLGRGQTALRILYERGIDHMLRSNGLAAEATDRFINHCLVPRQPLYYPCMMEFTGGMLAAVNEMLLQSYENVIRVFPAIPDGKRDYSKALRHGYSINEYTDRFCDYPAWNTVSFEKLLAKGAFEVSASLENSSLIHISVHSLKGGRVKITSPFLPGNLTVKCGKSDTEYTFKEGIISFDTIPGETYSICPDGFCENKFTNADSDNLKDIVISHETYTKRMITIGDNPESIYRKAIDGFIRDWYVGNTRLTNHTVYKFDFSRKNDKRYNEELTRQAFVAEEKAHWSLPPVTFPGGNLEYTDLKGYGFLSSSEITIAEREGPDLMRCDFAEGTKDAEFIIDAPRGQYELLVISGDAEEESVTIVRAANGRSSGGEVIKKGRFQCKLLPLVNECDEPIRLKLSTLPGYKWKLNFLMLNQIKGF